MADNMRNLSVTDLSLDSAFLTAREDGDEIDEPTVSRKVHQCAPSIRSQALVDSDNVESSDNDATQEFESARTAKFTIGDDKSESSVSSSRLGVSPRSQRHSNSRKISLNRNDDDNVRLVVGTFDATSLSRANQNNDHGGSTSKETASQSRRLMRRRQTLLSGRSQAVDEYDGLNELSGVSGCGGLIEVNCPITIEQARSVDAGICRRSRNDNFGSSNYDCNKILASNKTSELETTRKQVQRENSPNIEQTILIKIEDYFSQASCRLRDQQVVPEEDERTSGDNTILAKVLKSYNSDTANLERPISQHQQLLQPPPPPPSPSSDTAVGANSRHLYSGSTSSVTRLGSEKLNLAGGGSVSDNSHQCSAQKEAMLERRQMEERLRNWKKSNKIITHIRENPFNMHMDCLERLNQQVSESAASDHEPSTKSSAERVASPDVKGATSEQNNPNQNLQNYATHLSYLYRRNQTIMDNNNDFRTLLYNIICCLLIQDDQVLATSSVTKMIDVIRTYLNSAAKCYSASMSKVGVIANNSTQTQSQLLCDQQIASASGGANEQQNSRRKSSVGSLSCTSSASSGFITSNNNASQKSVPTDYSQQHQNYLAPTNNNLLAPQVDSSRSQRPADFRRISSVSYNDEQLINDLCDVEVTPNSNREANGDCTGTGGECKGQAIESPWRYEELSSECKHHSSGQHHPLSSESSLEFNNHSNTLEDSGIGGTIYDYYTDERKIKSGKRTVRARHSDAGEFRPKQQPSYMSTDDYFDDDSINNRNTTMTYDDDNNSSQALRSHYELAGSEQRSVDVASRRAELEWTLNKLINLELKYTWLTSKDTLRRAIRKIGVPNEIRGKVWLILIDQMIGNKYDAAKLLEEAGKTIDAERQYQNDEAAGCLSGVADEETQGILKQIDLDVNRTMPGHKLFDDGAEGGIKLRRILVAYSIHINRAIAYCQGFNFIVALLLSVFEGDEEKALRGFVCIVDHIFPSKFYFDHYLTGARADQFLLADFICDQLIKNPTTAERKMVEGVTSSITLNWFISLFHGAVPTLTRLTILDHFMLEGVKALFRFTMAILYLAFQVTPPSSCDVFAAIRNTAKDMYDIKLLLSIVEQIKLPKDSYFAIRRSFYMVQSSFNSDQFYMQSLSNDASRQLVSNKPLSLQQLPDTKAPAMSLITAASLVAHQSFGISGDHMNSNLNANSYSSSAGGAFGPRVCTSSDRTKVCIQNIGKLGRSHLKIMDVNVRSNERSLMSPLRNCLVIGISNCGKNIIVARQSSRRNYKTFRDQDLIFHIHEICTEIFDGFYIEECHLAIVITHMGEIFKIDTSKCFTDSQVGSTETLMLRDSQSIGENEKVKLRLASIDVLTNLLWIYVECEDIISSLSIATSSAKDSNRTEDTTYEQAARANSQTKFRTNNPFLSDLNDTIPQGIETQARANYQRKILIVDIITFDIFSAFTVHSSFGDISKMRTALVSFCQHANPMSNQFSSRIVRIGPTGRYEHLLSFCDVVDFMITVPESLHKRKQEDSRNSRSATGQRYSSIKRLLPRSMSLNQDNQPMVGSGSNSQTADTSSAMIGGTLTKYYRSLMKSHSTVVEDPQETRSVEARQNLQNDTIKGTCRQQNGNNNKSVIGCNHSSLPRVLTDHPSRAIITSYLGHIDNEMDTNYTPVNMAFIFRNGKIALFEFTESYAIHTRESQLDRYDYSKIIEVTKNGNDFIITILTIFDKLIKVVI